MGFDVWVARNDRRRQCDGVNLGSMARTLSALPLQFDAATNRTIELIDVLWLDGAAIVAAFEIECTTSVYSGLLRMADLLAMQPNINIPLFIVAPEDRGEKVIHEVNRPTFRRLSPPLSDVCRFISISSLERELAALGHRIRFMRPEFLDDVAESCTLADE